MINQKKWSSINLIIYNFAQLLLCFIQPSKTVVGRSTLPSFSQFDTSLTKLSIKSIVTNSLIRSVFNWIHMLWNNAILFAIFLDCNRYIWVIISHKIYLFYVKLSLIKLWKNIAQTLSHTNSSTQTKKFVAKKKCWFYSSDSKSEKLKKY